MAIRAPKTAPTGTSGESFVKGHFEKLGWGVMPNPYHDVGTDMVAQARDEGGFDLGLLLGVQVKSGPTSFNEPCKQDGIVIGWWFRADEDHFDYWLGHQAAHIIVLHDQDTGIAFWVQVTSDRVIATGKDRKILVPANQTIDARHQEELIRVAQSKADTPQWEGSAWELNHDIPEEAKLRYALVAPRLLAPHPNAQAEEISAVQAIALFVRQEFQQIRRLYAKAPLLDPAAVVESSDWSWRFYAALQLWLDCGDQSQLAALVQSAPGPGARAASSVCLSHAKFEVGEVSDALTVIEEALMSAGLSAADAHWLTMHKARIAVELGELDAAREAAQDVKGLDGHLLKDPTIRVLLGSASELLLSIGDWDEATIADVVKGRDNWVNLWRSQLALEGLDEQVANSFRDWAPDQSVTIGAADVPSLRFRSVMLHAGYAADTPGWRHAATQFARHALMSQAADTFPAFVFELLMFAGADKDLARLADRLLRHGPIEPLWSAGAQVDLGASTRTSLQSAIGIVTKSGDLLPAEVCDRHARFALAVLSGTEPTVQRTQPRFFVGDAVLKMLRSLWRGLSPEMKDEVKEHILNLPAIKDQLVAGGYGRLVRQMGHDIWSDDEVARLASRSGGDENDNFELTDEVEGLRASRSPKFRASLLERVADGDLRALANYGNVTDLPEETAGKAIRALAVKVGNQTASAREGAYGMGGPDILRALVLLNVWHPTQADWAPCYEAFAEEQMMAEHLEGALRLISAVPSKLEGAVLDGLRAPLESIRDRASFPGAFCDSSDGRSIRSEAALALALLFRDGADPTLLTRLLRGDAGQRTAAARILLDRQEASTLMVLSTLSRDVDYDVRLAVAGGLARWVVEGVAREASLEVVEALLQEPGTQIGFAVAGALSPDEDGEGSRLVAGLLTTHPSAAVRVHVEQVLRGNTA